MLRVLLILSLPALAACGFSGTPSLSTIEPDSVIATSSSPTLLAATPAQTPIPPTVTPPSATAFPDPGVYAWKVVAAGLVRPVDIQSARDGTGRLFIIEKPGRIRILQNGMLLERSFLDIDDRVRSFGIEQGLLGLAFHPHYSENGSFFLNYIDRSGATVISRFEVSTDRDLADAAGEEVLLRIRQPFENHNGGGLAFGPDGFLYAGLGDGGGAGDPFGNAQNLDTLLGKILRLDVNGAKPYVLPSDNPFGNEIWAYGFRNPWRISFDSLTGDLYIGDVGQEDWEEIDFVPAGSPNGLNFGWDHYEGDHPFSDGGSQAEFVYPVAEYSHDLGCSVIGGYVYRGSMLEWNGIYLYGDYCSGTIWGLIRSGSGWQNQPLFDAGMTITSFGLDESGEIYFASDGGSVHRLSIQ